MLTADHLMIDRRIMQEAASLVADGWEVKLLAGFECPEHERYDVHGIEVERFVYDWSDPRFDALCRRLNWTSRGWLYGFALRVFRRFIGRFKELNSFERWIADRMIEQSFDVVHANDLPMLAPGIAIAAMRQVPLVYDSHEFYPMQVQFSKLQSKQMVERERGLIKQAAHVITVNPYIAKEMAQTYDIATPSVIMNASPMEEIAPRPDLRSEIGVDDDAVLLLYQGWISSNRGIENIVKALPLFDSQLHLLVVGYGEYEQELKNLAKALGVAARITFYGRVEPEELKPISAACDLGVIPYYGVDLNNYYCSPNKLFEFAMAEVPVIANELPFLSDVFTEYGSGVTTKIDDPEAFAATVNEMLGQPGELERLKAGAKRARQELNWDVEGEKFVDIYQQLTA